MSSMKKFFLLLFFLLMIPVPSSADPDILLDERGLKILIEELVQEENDIRLMLKCENTEQYDREITLADLFVGEMPGSFRYGWGTEFFRLGSDETILYEINEE